MIDRIDIVFDEKRDKFVGLEDSKGNSIKSGRSTLPKDVGEWIPRQSGYWSLRIPTDSMKMCDPKYHELMVICRRSTKYGIEEVIRWCRNCGCIVGDVDVDNRVYPGKWFKMMAPFVLGEK